jgi:hypothetical protein
MTRPRKSLPGVLAIWAAILAGHLALIQLLVRLDGRSPATDLATTPAFIWLPRPEPIPPPALPAPATKAPSIRRDPTSTAAPIAPAETPAQAPRIDWYQQGEIVGQQGIPKAGPKTFSKPPTVLRSACKPKPSSFRWKAPRTGRTVGDLRLPYIKLGKRCVVGLGFFGCNVGALPEVDGHLLDDFRDPDRSTSSVPSLDECAKPAGE